jgi:hypothetical protein
MENPPIFCLVMLYRKSASIGLCFPYVLETGLQSGIGCTLVV